MDRRDFYFRQKVTEAELDGAFDDVEAALWNAAADHGLVGIASGMDPAQNGVPNLTINVSGPGVAYDASGQRIAIPSTQNVDVSVDENSVSTAVAGGGNEKYVSVFIEFDRTLSDPRIDGNSLGLFFLQTESFRFVVRQGAEAPAGTATPVPLDSGLILVCDILRADGVTTILDAAIELARRQDFIRLEGLTLELVAGTTKEAVAALLQHLVDHVDGAGSVHPASSIDYGGSGNWASAIAGIGAVTVEAALDAVVSSLATTANPDGAARVGARANGTLSAGSVRSQLDELDGDIQGHIGAGAGAHAATAISYAGGGQWADLTTNPATTVEAQLDKIISDLAGEPGSAKIGVPDTTVGEISLFGGTLQDQLAQIAGFLNEARRTTWDVNFTHWYGSGAANWGLGGPSGNQLSSSADLANIRFPIGNPPPGARIDALVMRLDPGGTRVSPNRTQMGLFRIDSSGTASSVQALTENPAGSGNAEHTWTVALGAPHTWDPAYFYYISVIAGNDGGGHQPDVIERLYLTLSYA